MLTVIRNPTRRQFEALISRSTDETVRGIVCSMTNDVFLCDGGARIHQQLADENGVDGYHSFTINEGWDDDHAYRIDSTYAFTFLNFLKYYPVHVGTVGIVQAKK